MSGNRLDVAVVHGRFQPLHVGHLEYLLAGKSRCRTLIVGITNPDPTQVAVETTAPHRAEESANPFTFYERHLMVDGALGENGVAPEEFRIVPFPHSFPERLKYYVPDDAAFLMTIYDAWGEEKLRRFTELGRHCEVLWRSTSAVTSGTAIRQRIRHGQPWEHLVPSATAEVIRRVPADRLGVQPGVKRG
ncbi:MAG: hypothetical protein ACRDTG_03530 [Pseudonocardiaceae bacterium]